MVIKTLYLKGFLRSAISSDSISSGSLRHVQRTHISNTCHRTDICCSLERAVYLPENEGSLSNLDTINED